VTHLLSPQPPAELPVHRVALLSVHTSPLDQPGTGDGGGLNVYVREVAEGMAEQGVEVDVFTRRTDPMQPASVVIAPGVTVHHLAAGPPEPIDKHEVTNHLCAFLLALQSHPTAGTHDVLHAHYWLSGWVGRRIAPRWGVPLVQTFHTLGVLKNATLAPGDVPEPPLRLHAEERVARSADRVLVLTCGEARLLHTTYGLSGARLTVVPAGVDLDRFSPRPLATTALGAPVAPEATPELLFVGRLQPLKGPDIALRTLAEVRRAVPGARLRVVGGASGNGQGRTGPAELRALAEELGIADAVIFEDALAQDELAKRYRSAAVLLAPSRSETFGLVALESQACGTPVVGADVPGLEAVVRGGGTLVPNHDPVDHAAAVVRLLTDPAHAAAARRAGLAAARAASWDRTVERLLAVYADVVAGYEDARGVEGGLPVGTPVETAPERRSA
jgi:D-inositol-3-phosphate glycosyltransferase